MGWPGGTGPWAEVARGGGGGGDDGPGPPAPGGPAAAPARTALEAAAVVLTAVAAFFGYSAWWTEPPIFNSDTPSYMRVAAELKGFRLTQVHSRTPGYPLVMLLTGSEHALNRSLFHAMLGAQLAAALVMMYLLAELGVSRPLAYSAFAVALLPPYVGPSAYAMTESVCALAVVIAYASAVLWARDGGAARLLWFAAAAGYAAMVRPTFQLLAPVVAAALVGAWWARWTGHRRLGTVVASMALASAVAYASLGAFAYLNYRRFGQFETSSMGARAYSSKVAAVLEYLPDDHADLRRVLVKHRDALITEPFRNHTGQDYIYRAMPDLLAMHGGDEAEALRAVKEASLLLIRMKPLTFVHESLKLIPSFWMPVDYEVPPLRRGPGRAASAALQLAAVGAFALQSVVVLGLMLTWASVRLATGRRGWWPLGEPDKALSCAYVCAFAVVAYTMVVSCFMGVGDNRYRTPSEPLILANIAIGFTLWGRSVRALTRAAA